MNRCKSLIIAFSLTMTGLVSCAQKPSVEQAKVQLCTSIAAYNQAVASLNAISGSSTVGQLKDAQKEVKKAKEAVIEAASKYQKAEVNQLKQSANKLENKIASIPDKATLAQAKQSIAPDVVAVLASVKQINSQLQCP
ncbi:hypothetical protein IQ264_29020 [Phormidium sp. LEGE 05292]|uniref:hypothetical protein n=1 Tax=[Phormidium] sp. LEGE 05292 TaxID=767427 RepID=UPI0018825B62|nr:hypothetical protein [Phormidium sp. LEGE 05292]MBE9229452.1 hypothetical protein [Phormidium sp. LEGE 05292]